MSVSSMPVPRKLRLLGQEAAAVRVSPKGYKERRVTACPVASSTEVVAVPTGSVRSM